MGICCKVDQHGPKNVQQRCEQEKEEEDGPLDSAGSVYEPVLGSCEQNNELWIHKR